MLVYFFFNVIFLKNYFLFFFCTVANHISGQIMVPHNYVLFVGYLWRIKKKIEKEEENAHTHLLVKKIENYFTTLYIYIKQK